MGWLAVGGVTASAAEHPVVVVSANGTSWQAADGERVFGAPGLFTEQAAADGQGYVIVGYQNIRQVRSGQVVSGRTVAAAWWSASLTGWQRAGTAPSAGTAGALDGPGARQMLAVAVSSAGFVAVGSHGDQPSAWTSADGRSWRQADLPLPVGSTRAVLQHVASTGRIVAAVGTALTTTGVSVPFAASSSDGGASWIESALPVPAGLTSVTALAAADGRLHRHRDLRPYRRSSERGGVDVAERVGVARGRADRTGPDRVGHPGHHRPYRVRQHAGRRRLHRLAGRRGARLLAVPDQVTGPRSGNGYWPAEHIVPAVNQAGQAGPDGPDQVGIDFGDRH